MLIVRKPTAAVYFFIIVYIFLSSRFSVTKGETPSTYYVGKY